MAVITESDNNTKRKTMEALEKTRKNLPDEVRKELDRIWRKIADDARLLCPKDTGTLAKTIRVVKAPKGLMSRLAASKEITIINRSIIAGDLMKINPKSGRPCDYARLVHDGHRLRDGSFWNGVPFLTEALAKNEAELNRAIERALKKLGKKFEEI